MLKAGDLSNIITYGAGSRRRRGIRTQGEAGLHRCPDASNARSLVSLSADFAKTRPVAPASHHQRNRMPPRRPQLSIMADPGEYNRVQVDEAYDLVTTTLIGAFSPAFVRKFAGVIKETVAQRRLRGIVRK